MAKFEVFRCNVCSRDIEKEIDQTHAPIFKCNITYKCSGTLSVISKSDTKTTPFISPQSTGLTNWVPRGNNSFTNAPIPETLVSLNDAQNILSIAIESSSIDEFNQIYLDFEVRKSSNSSSIEYFYNRPSNTQLISGQDDSSKKITLRFLESDSVTVYLNGVEIEASEYNRDIPGRLLFNSALTEDTNQIRVLVYQQTPPKYVRLTFIRNDSGSVITNPMSSWRNISKISTIPNKTFDVFSCTNLSHIELNSSLVLRGVLLENLQTLVGEFGYWLLSDPPYSSFDRNTSVAILLSDIITSGQPIEYKNDTKISPKFFVSSSLVKSLFPNITIIQKLSNDIDLKISNDVNTRLLNEYIT